MSDRHPSTRHLLSLFEHKHLPPHLQEISKPIHDLAHRLVDQLKDGPELSAGLRRLWDAKNNLVMQRVIDKREEDECERHGGPWGEDETCPACTDEHGVPRARTEES